MRSIMTLAAMTLATLTLTACGAPEDRLNFELTQVSEESGQRADGVIVVAMERRSMDNLVADCAMQAATEEDASGISRAFERSLERAGFGKDEADKASMTCFLVATMAQTYGPEVSIAEAVERELYLNAAAERLSRNVRNNGIPEA